MKIEFMNSNHEEAAGLLGEHLGTMQYPLDAYMEQKLLASTITKVTFYDEEAEKTREIGYFGTITDTIWFYYIQPAYFSNASDIFEQFIAETGIKKATVLTCDVPFQAVLSDFEVTLLSKEGRYYADGGPAAKPDIGDLKGSYFRLATTEDIAGLEATVIGYHSDFGQLVAAGNAYVLEQGDELLGCGILRPSGLFNGWISLGVNIVSEHRRKGAATMILWYLKETAYKRGLKIMVGCWYCNTIIGKALAKVNMIPIAKEMSYLIGARDILPAKSGTLTVTEADEE